MVTYVKLKNSCKDVTAQRSLDIPDWVFHRESLILQIIGAGLRACEEPIYIFFALIDKIMSFRNANLELRYSGVVPCKDLYTITAADSNL